MVYRLPSQRIALDLDGPSVEVERLTAPGVWVVCNRELAVLVKAKGTDAQAVAMLPLAERFILEAQPVWDFADHRGPIPVTAAGMLRLPDMGLELVMGWMATIEEPETAVDKMVPPGELRDELKRRLKAA